MDTHSIQFVVTDVDESTETAHCRVTGSNRLGTSPDVTVVDPHGFFFSEPAETLMGLKGIAKQTEKQQWEVQSLCFPAIVCRGENG